MYVDNISDHVPVQVAINYTDLITSSNLVNEQSSIPKPKVHWTKFTKDEINENYTALLLTNLSPPLRRGGSFEDPTHEISGI